MMSLGIHHEIPGIEAGIFWEGREVQNSNLDCRQGSAVVIALVEVVE